MMINGIFVSVLFFFGAEGNSFRNSSPNSSLEKTKPNLDKSNWRNETPQAKS